MYSNYGTYGTTTTSVDPGSIIAGVFAVLGIFLIFAVAIAVVVLIAKYKMFKKMGIDGWKSLIPMVSDYLQLEATGVSQKWLLVLTFSGVVSIIPILGALVLFAIVIYYAILTNVSLARSFGKSDGFAVGLILLAPIFLCILGFGSAKYVGKKPMSDFVFKN